MLKMASGDPGSIYYNYIIYYQTELFGPLAVSCAM
jgi:hypothetical protein